jgi:MoaA/NifB/PqqE/SkfB family radical SAM enzyme
LKANITPGYDKNRIKLADIIPIPTPFTLFITPSQLCNFRCFYCTQNVSNDEKNKIGFKQQLLDYNIFLKIAHQAAAFPVKFKRVLLTGLGEPLMNKNIPDMVSELAKLGVADKYEIFTNAYLLTHEMSDKLLTAGLTGLRISIQGLSSKKYKEVCGTDIDFDKLLDNVEYFYKHKGNCRVYIKIMDACFDDEGEKEIFYNIFGNICDDIFIEHLVKAQPSMGDYENKADNTFTFYGEKSEMRQVCPYMFYTLQTDAVGNVFPCPPLGLPLSFSLGNISEISLKDIWYGDKLKSLKIAHLHRLREKVSVCGTCDNYLCFTPEEDNLDNDTEELLKRVINV